MIRNVIFALSVLFSSATYAETIEIRMLNRGEHGSMVYEPDYVALKPGDSLHFVSGNKSHNAASIDGMVPEGYPGFKGKIDEEITVTFDQPGAPGISGRACLNDGCLSPSRFAYVAFVAVRAPVP